MFEQQNLRRALEALGDVLTDRGLRFHVVIGGGAGLLLSGAGVRPTQDVDVVAVATDDDVLRQPFVLPHELAEAALDVAELHDLGADWLNAGAVAILLDRLPDGYEQRLTTRSFGNLDVSVLGRADLIRLKLYAAADEGPGSPHVQDLLSLGLTREELKDAVAWTRQLYPPDSPVTEVEDIAAILEQVAR